MSVSQSLRGKTDLAVFIVGVGGSGMSGLANLFLQKGWRVGGSDLYETPYMKPLLTKGLKFYSGHHEKSVEGYDLLVISSAIPANNAERQAAKRSGIPEMKRAEALAHLVEEREVCLVAGMHGKSTTASMLAKVLRAHGKDSGHYVGAEVQQLGGNATLGAGREMVIEGDESDGSIIHFSPDRLLLLNIESEHLDYYGSLEEILKTFSKLLEKTEKSIVANGDCSEVAKLVESSEQVWTYGFSDACDVEGRNAECRGGNWGCEVWVHGVFKGRLSVSVPGKHNLSNALGVVAMTQQMGLDMEKTLSGLKEFNGVGRRFEILYENDEITIVDDYAHHPTEIEVTLKSVRERAKGRIIAGFQPHRFSRTSELLKEFQGCFSETDVVVVTEIYAASESPIEGVDGKVVVRGVREDVTVGEAVFAPTLHELKLAISERIQKGDFVILMGAGSIYQVSRQLAEDYRNAEKLQHNLSEKSVVRLYEKMSKHTSLRVGGVADIWCEPATEEDLIQCILFCREKGLPLTVLGRGSNLLVRDGGVRGVVVFPGKEAFRKIEVTGAYVKAGAGVRLKEVVFQGKKAGIGGFSFMEGIPGNVGGGCRMNAGAMGGCMFDVIESIRYANRNGEVVEKKGAEIDAHYRNVPELEDKIVLSATFKGKFQAEEEISDELRGYSQKRWASQPAAPSGGCTFKNHESAAAGKVIDELGLKNLKVGGARVSDVHGNFIVNDGAATAEDVLMLIKEVQEKVFEARGISLEPELIVIGESRECEKSGKK